MHHLIDIRDPHESYDAGCFFNDVNKLVVKIQANNKLPILVGGTMMYLNTLINGLVMFPPIDKKYQIQANEYINDKGLTNAHAYLAKIDPVTASKFSINDKQRISRALTIFIATKKTPSEFNALETTKPSFNFDIYYLLPKDKDRLKVKLNDRFDQMISDGLVEETKAIVNKYGDKIDSLRSVGYRQIVEYLQGKTTFDEAIANGKQASRRLLKQQLTWIRKFNPAENTKILVD